MVTVWLVFCLKLYRFNLLNKRCCVELSSNIDPALTPHTFLPTPLSSPPDRKRQKTQSNIDCKTESVRLTGGSSQIEFGKMAHSTQHLEYKNCDVHNTTHCWFPTLLSTCSAAQHKQSFNQLPSYHRKIPHNND